MILQRTIVILIRIREMTGSRPLPGGPLFILEAGIVHRRDHRSPLFRWAFFLSAQLFFPVFSATQSIHFLCEDIQISVLGESCIVSGEYRFRNESGDTSALQVVYPFPHRTELPEPTTIEAEDIPTHSPL